MARKRASNMITPEQALKSFDDRYFKATVEKAELAAFQAALNDFLKHIDEINTAEKENSEENVKSEINDFLSKACGYGDADRFDKIYTHGNVDSAIKSRNKKLLVPIEVKKPSNTTEMIAKDNLAKKALAEIVYYYLENTRSVQGSRPKPIKDSEIRRLIVTDGYTWFLFDRQDIENLCTSPIGDGSIELYYYKYKNKQTGDNRTSDFYHTLIESFLPKLEVTQTLQYVYFDLREPRDDKALYKLMHREYLLKEGFHAKSSTQELNRNFYRELLYLMGLKEDKSAGKHVICIDPTIKNSLSDQVFRKLTTDKGRTKEEATEITFQLVLIWINRLLFIKLFEGQLLAFNENDKYYHILDWQKITSFQELNRLFFDVLGQKDRNAGDAFIGSFEKIPYLNSSLFERQEIEKNNLNISDIQDSDIKKRNGSVLGKKADETLKLLKYLLDFLDMYRFTAQRADADGRAASTEIIDASVLGMIFEKINGYKEGSFYTKDFVTEYICRETVEKAVIDKLNKAFHWTCKTIEDLRWKIDKCDSAEMIREINEQINAIRICDPAVGSGHFLVSALNRILALKYELGVLTLRGYRLVVTDDTLCVLNGRGEEFRYVPTDPDSQRVQKTLFCEKRAVIENCLFGVDVNPNAAEICRLRLWIELLKSAYYEENGVMETLPNIDINIKCGNSLVHKLGFAVGQKIGGGEIGKKSLDDYRNNVKAYHSEPDKAKKAGVAREINRIKVNLYSACEQMVMEGFDSGDRAEHWSDDRFRNAFEWAIEFPELLSDDGRFLGFDCVVGNPPYIRVQELPHEDVDYYKAVYSTALKRIDISTLFIELAHQLVREGGYVSYITSNQFLTAEYGKTIRGFLVQSGFIQRIVEFGDLPVFDEALTYVDVFFFQRQKRAGAKSFQYYKVPQLPFAVPTAEQFTEIDCATLDNADGWVLGDPQTMACVAKIKAAAQKRLKAYADCCAGVATGIDELLLFKKGREIPFEEEMAIPVIRAENCSRYGRARTDNLIYYPYEENGRKTKLLSLQAIEKRFPKTYAFIMENETKLKGRKDSREKLEERAGWYGLVRFGNLSLFRKRKIVTPGEVKHNKFTLDESGAAFSIARVFAVAPKDDAPVSVEYLLGFLNSALCEFYLHNTAPAKASGYYNYNAEALKRIPMIYDSKAAPGIERRVAEILRLTEAREDASGLEAEIDEIIFSLYGLSEEERETVRASLRDS